jgi:Tat protein translocase TatB subunit
VDLFEIVAILVIALIVLGPERLPEVLQAAGKIMRELRLASNTVLRELSDAIDDDTLRAPVRLPAPRQQPAAAPEESAKAHEEPATAVSEPPEPEQPPHQS